MTSDAQRAGADADAAPELDRLRALVGPDEMSYADVAAERDAARDAVRAAEAEAGRLRGQITELELELHRARQDQFHLQRVLLRPVAGLVRRLRRRGR